MLILSLEFAALAAAVIVAGTFLAHCADAIGVQTGLGRTLAGLVLLAGATSLPELAVDCAAAWAGAPNLAVGDLLGSSLFNLLILAVMDLTVLSRGRMLSRMAAAHALSALMSIVLTAIVLLFMLLEIRWDYYVGPGSVTVGVVYVLLLRLIFYDQMIATQQTGQTPPTGKADEETQIPLRRAIIGYLVATAVVFFVAPLLAHTAERLAEESGLGQTFVGTTLLALSTSLPEMVTTLTALRMGAIDLAVGNIFGSNSINMAILFFVDFFYAGPLLASISTTHRVTAVATILITAIATTGLLYRAERRFRLIEPDALLILVLVLGALGLVYYLG